MTAPETGPRTARSRQVSRFWTIPGGILAAVVAVLIFSTATRPSRSALALEGTESGAWLWWSSPTMAGTAILLLLALPACVLLWLSFRGRKPAWIPGGWVLAAACVSLLSVGAVASRMAMLTHQVLVDRTGLHFRGADGRQTAVLPWGDVEEVEIGCPGRWTRAGLSHRPILHVVAGRTTQLEEAWDRNPARWVAGALRVVDAFSALGRSVERQAIDPRCERALESQLPEAERPKLQALLHGPDPHRRQGRGTGGD